MQLITGIRNIINALFNPTAESIEIRDRKRLFTIYLLFFSLPLFTLGVKHVWTGLYSYGISDILLSLLFIFFISVLPRMKTGKMIYRATLVIIELLLAYWLVTTTGISFYPSIFILTLPPFAFFLMGLREGFIWTAVISILTVLVFVNPGSLINPPYPQVYITRHLIALFLVILFTYNYESVRRRFKNAMETEQRNLLLEKEHLARTKNEVEIYNQRLKNEMDVRGKAEDELRRHRDHLEDLVTERTREIRTNALKLEASEKLFRLLADNVNDMIWSMDLDLTFTFMTPSVTMLYGYSVDEAMNLPLDRWNTPASLKIIMNEYSKQIELEKTGTADPNRFSVFQIEQIKKDGTLLDIEMKVSFIRDASGEAIGIVGITRDITERIQYHREKEKAQEQLAQVQKQEALGTLVGGIAHDFNNILVGIMGSFNLLDLIIKEKEIADREEIEHYLGIGLDSARRSADLIKQLLVLSKKHNIVSSLLDVNEPIRYILKLCRNSFPKSIEFDFRFSQKPLTIMGDMMQIEQVLLNLCINSSHAMTIMREPDEKQGGVLTVQAEEFAADSIEDALPTDLNGSVKSWIRIQISDTGVGMNQETRQRIFEPFFTSKQKKEGMGLGLSISYNIIQKHGGLITVYSEPGVGSRFTIYLPYHENSGGLIPTGEPEHDIIKGSGTILIIDDEALVLDTVKGFLRQCGYDVLTAKGADQGIAIYRENHYYISAVIIDLSMPDKTGLDVFRELKNINGDVRAILSSGMLDNESIDTAFSLGIKDIINKPYLSREISEKIKKVIG